jgi:hypothetical protein
MTAGSAIFYRDPSWIELSAEALALGPVQLKQYGLWEIQAGDASAKMLPPAILTGAPMPLVLAVFPSH